MSSFFVIHHVLGTLLFAVQLNVFISYGYLTLFEYTFRIKTKTIRKSGGSQSFPELAKFYAEWNNYSYAACDGPIHQKVFLSVNKV